VKTQLQLINIILYYYRHKLFRIFSRGGVFVIGRTIWSWILATDNIFSPFEAFYTLQSCSQSR